VFTVEDFSETTTIILQKQPNTFLNSHKTIKPPQLDQYGKFPTFSTSKFKPLIAFDMFDKHVVILRCVDGVYVLITLDVLIFEEIIVRELPCIGPYAAFRWNMTS
jgi:hypothetical protein